MRLLFDRLKIMIIVKKNIALAVYKTYFNCNEYLIGANVSSGSNKG